jgi:hypothetical protein
VFIYNGKHLLIRVQISTGMQTQNTRLMQVLHGLVIITELVVFEDGKLYKKSAKRNLKETFIVLRLENFTTSKYIW